MPTSYTSLLGFALPVTGELQGTWGTVVNDNITELVEDSIAATATASVTSGNWTLSTTGSGAANEARCAILIPTGTPGVSRNIVAPSQSKAYVVINQSDAAVVVKGSATTGTTIAAGDRAVVAWNGSDFVTIASSAVDGGDVVGPASSTDNAVVRFDGTTGKLVQNSGVLIADDGTTVISVNSATDALRITQTGAGNALVVEDSANPDSTPFVVSADGKVFSGTNTFPSAVASGSYSFALEGNANFANGNAALIQNRNDASSSWLYFGKSRGTTSGSVTTVNSGDSLGVFSYYGSDGIAFIEAARITAAVDGTPGTNDMPGRLVFSTTADGASSVTERMRIDSAGRVGIGTSTLGGANGFLTLGTNLTGSTTVAGIRSSGVVQSDVTSDARLFRTGAATAAASFTLTEMTHYAAQQGTFGVGSTVTNQYGFYAFSSLINATNNYGFYSNIASGTGRWNFYANGTAENFFGGVTTFRAANAVRVEAAATQDAVVIAGRAGGSNSYASTITPTTLSASRTVTLPDETFTVGFRNIPPVGTKTGSYILAVGDVGKYVQVSTGGSITIPDATFAEGDVISLFNNTTGNITITCSITTAYIAGTDTDKATMTLSTRGVATILFISGTVCVVSGNVT